MNVDDLPGMVPGQMTVKGWTDPRQSIVDLIGTWFTLGSSVRNTGDSFITVDYVAPGWQRENPDGMVTLIVFDGPPVTGVVIALERGGPPQAFVSIPTDLFPGDAYTFRPADLIGTT